MTIIAKILNGHRKGELVWLNDDNKWTPIMPYEDYLVKKHMESD